MTSTVSREVGEGTQNLTYVLNPPVRRPNATGEFPIIRKAGVEELARLSAGETLVLPTDAPAHMPRHAAPTVYPKNENGPRRYRGQRRATDPAWAWMAIGAGSLLAGEFLAGLIVLAVTW